MEVHRLLATGEYDRLVYSAHPNESHMLGTGIFSVCKEVKYYIVSKLCEMGQVKLGKQRIQSQFEDIRQRFLRQHHKDIHEALSKVFVGKPVLNPAPMSNVAMERFCRCKNKYRSTGESFMVPALHGTNARNYASIFQEGLLIPGCDNNIKNANGSAYGLGVYTAKLNEPGLSASFCKQPSMLVCCVIDETRADLVEHVSWSSCQTRFRQAKTKKDVGKHTFDYVEDLEVWYECDDYAYYDIWSWCEWEEEPRPSPSENVKHVLDAMVVFDSSYVVPLFVASGSRLRNLCNCDQCVGIKEVDSWPWPPNSGHDGLMCWPRGWTARHGHRKMLSSPSGRTESGSCGKKFPMKHVSRKGSHAYACTWHKERDARSGHMRAQHSESPALSHSIKKTPVDSSFIQKGACEFES
mmetsp:Transcript_29525/g.57941  ORF Transcript_29525/g.57941 Transcript_29525/m.57941 type:complete len:409 (+) Transcript_29525:174-1400(+)